MEKEEKGGETEGPQSGTCSRQKWWWGFLLKSAVSVQTGGEAKKMKPPDSHFFVSLVYIILLMSLVLHYIQLPHKCTLII